MHECSNTKKSEAVNEYHSDVLGMIEVRCENVQASFFTTKSACS